MWLCEFHWEGGDCLRVSLEGGVTLHNQIVPSGKEPVVGQATLCSHRHTLREVKVVWDFTRLPGGWAMSQQGTG